MGWIGELLTAAGPFAGWAAFALLVLALLWFYASDRLVSHGRHREQADHYERRLTQQSEHFQRLLGDLEQRTEAHLNDKTYWRDVALDLMGTVASTVSRKDTDGTP